MKILWTLVAIYGLVTGLDQLLSLNLSPAGPVLTALIFGLTHGTVRYGWKGILSFLVLCLVISNAFENLSILTGFPFGEYHYTEYLGLKVFLVPLIIGPAYFSTGYIVWVLATVLVGEVRRGGDWVTTISVPFIASFVMVLWDLAFDPSSSTVTKAWIWEQGGGYFGVPISNYLGWFFTVYLFYQSFALYLHFRKAGPEDARAFPRAFYAQPVVMYALIGLSFVLAYVMNDSDSSVTDATGTVWSTASIIETKAIVTICTIIFVSALSAVKLLQGSRSVAVGQHQAQEHGHDGDDDRPDDGVPDEVVDMEREVELVGEPRGELQHRPIDDE
ncbi:MAG: hypothetical protein QOE58_3643 [Actinomycetota bacterium]|nr:hypothetical protein [Actinomycetota bacterium]